MVTGATSSFGILLKIGDGGGPEVFTAIAELMDTDGPDISVDTEEVTTHSSPGGWDEHIATIKRGGDVTFGLNWLPQDPTHSFTSGLLKDLDDLTLRNFQLTWTDVGTTVWPFSALVTNFKPAGPVAGKLGVDVTLKISGQPPFA